jgi:hypothetical protein
MGAVNADDLAMRRLSLLHQRRDQAPKQGLWELAKFMEWQRMGIETQEAILRGDMESRHALSEHEGYRKALRAGREQWRFPRKNLDQNLGVKK